MATHPLLALTLVIYGDVVTTLENAIISFFQTIFNGIANFFGTIFGALANTLGAIFNAPVQAVQSSFASLSTWAAQYGPLAPIITILIVSVVLLIGAYVIWLIIKLSVSEGEQTLGEAEEGV